jgi:hypothetical protein
MCLRVGLHVLLWQLCLCGVRVRAVQAAIALSCCVATGASPATLEAQPGLLLGPVSAFCRELAWAQRAASSLSWWQAGTDGRAD